MSLAGNQFGLCHSLIRVAIWPLGHDGGNHKIRAIEPASDLASICFDRLEVCPPRRIRHSTHKQGENFHAALYLCRTVLELPWFFPRAQATHTSVAGCSTAQYADLWPRRTVFSLLCVALTSLDRPHLFVSCSSFRWPPVPAAWLTIANGQT